MPLPLPGTAGDAVVSEVQHPDGRWKRVYASGLREQHFGNGDVKKVLACGTVEYFYAEVASWQVTHPAGVDVFFFPSGQVEAHHPAA
ncbi:hypothetical protein ABPG75_007178 [Micractinium tetrahymenae]